eukprot:TRINITY_DN7837_c0_g1_i1.p1 TRINITY_DN7837_c0_g1~~TRINITY_DN7837_c0_g1_i1.p1  ORF type:complete len:347 (+),score=67.43 TRINITY_DN7837_c0_g1_i1:74-1114(+)
MLRGWICHKSSICSFHPAFFFRALRVASPHGLEEQRRLLEEVAKKLDVKRLEDWFQFNTNNIRENGGRALVRRHRSIVSILRYVYPDQEWKEDDFGRQRSPWLSEDLQRHQLEKIGKELGVQTLDDWYRVRSEDILSRCWFVTKFYSSMSQALMTLFPDHHWEPWRFSKVPHGYWDSKENRRLFFDAASKKLGLQTWQDWYKIKREQVIELGGGHMIFEYYNGSLSRALAALYSEHPWHPWLFDHVPPGFWNDEVSVRNFLRWIAEKRGFKSAEDWSHLSTREFRDFGGDRLLEKFGGLQNIVAKFCSQDFHQASRNQSGKIKTQKRLIEVLKENLQESQSPAKKS